MNRAFIFDMDGVLVDSERTWDKHAPNFLIDLLGREIAEKVGDTTGVSIDQTYQIAIDKGFKMSIEEYYEIYDKKAAEMYLKSPHTKNVDRLVDFLIDNKFKIGLVTSSRVEWINSVLPHTNYAHKFHEILSLNTRPDLGPKPSPLGYIEMIKTLGSLPSETIILEDSISGVKAGKGAGAFVISFREHSTPTYKHEPTDAIANNMEEVIEVVRFRIKNTE